MNHDEAVFTIAAYREKHKIEPRTRVTGTTFFDSPGGLRLPAETYCAFDGLRLDARKGGFVHSQMAIFRAQDLAGYVPVGRCQHRYIPGGLACNLTLGRHLREKRLRQINPTLPPLHDFTE